MYFSKTVAGLMLALCSMALVADVVARPLGGGRSFGRQSHNIKRQVPPATPAIPASQRQSATPAAAPTPALPPATPAGRWKGMLGGALLGLGMGALLAHFGLGGALASMLGSLLMLALLALAVVLIFRIVRRKDRQNAAAAERRLF
jgi:predicted lipid-binding transport protein (Tim44 family)